MEDRGWILEVKLRTIGVVRSCFKERFGIPRQPGLVPQARAIVEVAAEFGRTEAFRGLREFSHIWVIFMFHRRNRADWRPTVRPPRLGGARRVGIFASRSPDRPNPIGMSVVELEGIDEASEPMQLRISGVDLLDGTPVLDIKPYLAYADAVTGARGGYAPDAPAQEIEVAFTETALGSVRARERAGASDLQALIVRLLSADPRPAYYRSGQRQRDLFGMRLLDFDLRWRTEGRRAVVTALEDAASDPPRSGLWSDKR